MRAKTALGLVCLVTLCSVAGACSLWTRMTTHRNPNVTQDDRLAMLERAQVWKATNVGAMDLRNGPTGPGTFPRGQTVRCDYVEEEMNGRSPKFMCTIPGQSPDKVKVKYGVDNAEVYGEVMSTRLLWALGFGADRMYPVRVICRGCPPSIETPNVLPTGERVFDPAVIERKAAGWEIESRTNEGWSWPELRKVDPARGGAPLAHRDALALLAVMIQHSDSKSAQQRLICLDGPTPPQKDQPQGCARPFMMIQDLGLTFGKTDFLFRKVNYVNLERWASATVFDGSEGCVGNLKAPVLGTLERPIISEAGRAFLANLLGQLGDAQLRDLFGVARVELRSESPESAEGRAASVDDWVAAFKKKRQEISDRRCGATTDSQ
jgi:hypothetical protein